MLAGWASMPFRSPPTTVLVASADGSMTFVVKLLASWAATLEAAGSAAGQPGKAH